MNPDRRNMQNKDAADKYGNLKRLLWLFLLAIFCAMLSYILLALIVALAILFGWL